MKTAGDVSSKAQVAPDFTLSRLLGYFLSLGRVGFGGPIALAGYMQRDLVEKRRWITPEEYVEGLALAQLAPGPLAAQLAMYLGYVRAGFMGATLVGFAFIGLSFVMVLAIAAAYVRFGGLSWMQALFSGIGAAVIGIIARSAWKLGRVTIGKDLLLWIIFLVLAVSTAVTEQEIIWLFLGGGVVSLAVKAFPRALLKPNLPMLAPSRARIRNRVPVGGDTACYRQVIRRANKFMQVQVRRWAVDVNGALWSAHDGGLS